MTACFVLVCALLLAERVVAEPTPDSSAARNDLEQRFRAADRNGDGSLSAAEAQQGGWFVDQMDRFEGMDRDGSGTVTLFELTTVVSEKIRGWLGADADRDGRVTESEAKRQSSSFSDVWSRADANRDRVVTQDEFERFSHRSYYDNVDMPSVVPNIIEKRF